METINVDLKAIKLDEFPVCCVDATGKTFYLVDEKQHDGLGSFTSLIELLSQYERVVAAAKDIAGMDDKNHSVSGAAKDNLRKRLNELESMSAGTSK